VSAVSYKDNQNLPRYCPVPLKNGFMPSETKKNEKKCKKDLQGSKKSVSLQPVLEKTETIIDNTERLKRGKFLRLAYFTK
jgi:hypothetical protein